MAGVVEFAPEMEDVFAAPLLQERTPPRWVQGLVDRPSILLQGTDQPE
jgi:hypothetical protein